MCAFKEREGNEEKSDFKILNFHRGMPRKERIPPPLSFRFIGSKDNPEDEFLTSA